MHPDLVNRFPMACTRPEEWAEQLRLEDVQRVSPNAVAVTFSDPSGEAERVRVTAHPSGPWIDWPPAQQVPGRPVFYDRWARALAARAEEVRVEALAWHQAGQVDVPDAGYSSPLSMQGRW